MLDLNALPLPRLFAALNVGGEVESLIDLALREDLGIAGDITSASTFSAKHEGRGLIAAREAGIVAGLAALQCLLDRVGESGGLSLHMDDGQPCEPGQALAELNLPMRCMLSVERLALNILGRLSGIATLTRRYVEAVAGTRAIICDTRKTTPGMRVLEKFAVRCGGATLHRIGLHDAALFKDNHLAHIPARELTAALAAAARRARQNHDLRFVEVEVDSLDQLERVLAIEAGLIDIVLLDNMQPEILRRAVEMRDRSGSAVHLEASGGVDLQTVRDIAETGVNRIAVGALTHSAQWLDVALDVEGGG